MDEIFHDTVVTGLIKFDTKFRNKRPCTDVIQKFENFNFFENCEKRIYGQLLK